MSTPLFKKLKKSSSRTTLPPSSPGGQSDVSFGPDSSFSSAGGDLSFDLADLDDADDSPAAAIAAARAARAKKKKSGTASSSSSGKAKAKSKLSFGGDDEEDESSSSSFVPKKSALSRAIASHVPPTSSPLASTTTPSSYSSVYLSELKASTPSRPSNRTVDDISSGGLSRETMLKYGITSDPLDSPSSAGGGVDTAIPTEAAILAAKAKRSHLRDNPDEIVSSADFIALDDRSGALSIRDQDSISDLAGSRLMREEDEIGDGEEEHAGFTGADERMALGKKGKKEARRREREGIREAIEDREADGVDDSEGEWEEAQIRRANLGAGDDTKRADKRKEPYRAAKIPNVLPLPTLSAASTRLSNALSNLTLAHAQSTHRSNAISAELGALGDQERELRKEVERVETKREWSEEFRSWCELLGEFLEVKFSELEKVEKDNLDLIRQRHSMIALRRLEDDADDISLCVGVPTDVDISALQPFVSPTPPSDPEEEEQITRLLDNLTIPPTANIRASRRTNRLGRLASSTTSPASTSTVPDASPLDQGYLTDSNLPQSDESDYVLARAALDQRRLAVFEDVKAVEMRDPEAEGGLIARFNQWRIREGGEEYRMAWGGEALVTALEFWARWEIASWDPLKSSETLDHFRFYTALYSYSRPKVAGQDDGSDEDMDEPALGSDGDLVASILTSTVIPRLVLIFNTPGSFDPFSSGQTRRAVDLLEQTEAIVALDGPSAKFTGLVQSVLAPFDHALATFNTLLTLSASGTPPPAFNPDSFAARLRFLGRLSKLARNVVAFRTWSREAVLQIVDGLVGIGQRLAETGWEAEEGGGKEWAARLLERMPKGVLSDEREARLRSGPPKSW